MKFLSLHTVIAGIKGLKVETKHLRAEVVGKWDKVCMSALGREIEKGNMAKGIRR